MADDDSIDRRMRHVAEALSDCSTREKLDVLLALWSMHALLARNEQLAFPNGFATELQRQLEQLAGAADLVTRPPDLEGQRLLLEGPFEAWLERLRQQLADPPRADDPQP